MRWITSKIWIYPRTRQSFCRPQQWDLLAKMYKFRNRHKPLATFVCKEADLCAWHGISGLMPTSNKSFTNLMIGGFALILWNRVLKLFSCLMVSVTFSSSWLWKQTAYQVYTQRSTSVVTLGDVQAFALLLGLQHGYS